jgi:general secretion pathway protein M
MKAWLCQFWDGLNERDRKVAYLGIISIFLYLSYALYSPLKQAVFQNKKILSEKKGLLVWMKAAKAQSVATPQKEQSVQLDGSKRLTVFSDALEHASFHALPYQLEQIEDGTLHLSFDAVPYNAFLSWLWSIGKRYTLVIKQLNVEKTDAPGLVKLTVLVAL